MRIPIFIAGLVLAGCAAAPPPLTLTSPASPNAPEGARLPWQSSLAADEATRKTAALLSAAHQEQQNWDAHGPVSGTPVETASGNSQPEMKHEHP